MASPPHKWTEVEDEILRQLIRENGKQWNIIAKHLPNRSVAQIASRWEKCLDPNLNKGAFTPEEDEIIRNYVTKNGARGWPRIVEYLPNRSAKQARERWYNHLDPQIQKGPWTPAEDLLIFQQHEKIGPKWATISKMISGRSDNAVKNRYNSSISKRIHIDSDGSKTLLPDSSTRQRKKSLQKEKMAPPPPLQLPIPLSHSNQTIPACSNQLVPPPPLEEDEKKDLSSLQTPFSPGIPTTPYMFTPGTIESGLFSPTSPFPNFSVTPGTATSNAAFLFSPTAKPPTDNDSLFKAAY